eukprot:g4005.t1
MEERTKRLDRIMSEARRIRQAVSPGFRQPAYKQRNRPEWNLAAPAPQQANYCDRPALQPLSPALSSYAGSTEDGTNQSDFAGSNETTLSLAAPSRTRAQPPTLSLAAPSRTRAQPPAPVPEHPAVAECARLRDAMEMLAREADTRIEAAESKVGELQAVVVRQEKDSEQMQNQIRKLIVQRSTSEAQLHQQFMSAQRKASEADARTYEHLKAQLEEKQEAMDKQRDIEIAARVAAAEKSAAQKWRAICERELERMRAARHKELAELRVEFKSRLVAQREAVMRQLKGVEVAWTETCAKHTALREKARALASSVRASRKMYALLQMEFKELSHFVTGAVRALEHSISIERQDKLRQEAVERKRAELDHDSNVEYFNRRRSQLHYNMRLE